MGTTDSKEDKVTSPNQTQVDGSTVKQNGFHPATTANKEQVEETTSEPNGAHRSRTLSIFNLINDPPATISEYCKPLLLVKFFGQTSDEGDEVYNF